jgi:transposase
MEAFSLDLRQRICAACDEGVETHAEVAQRYDVGRWFVQKLLRQRRAEGTLCAKPRGCGPRPLIGIRQERCLCEWIRQKPDATLAELCRKLHETQGICVSVPVMCRVLLGLGLRFKKNRLLHPNDKRRACGP